jgi:hypothetical protein
MSADDTFHSHTVFSDYPFVVPNGKVDFGKDYPLPQWYLLSYKKAASASSFLPGYETARANDEQVETWWAAQTGQPGEWWQVDLGKPMDVCAIQVNFADHDFTCTDKNSYVFYQYFIESSFDGQSWTRLIDHSDNVKDLPHALIPLERPAKARFLRITNARKMEGRFSMYDFRVFGRGGGKTPPAVPYFQAVRKEDRRRFDFSWTNAAGATGYILRWGVKKGQLHNAVMVMDKNTLEAGYFNRDSSYFFTIDAFNENGVTKGKKVYFSK